MSNFNEEIMNLLKIEVCHVAEACFLDCSSIVAGSRRGKFATIADLRWKMRELQ
jgi:hypothetical protein